MKHRFLTTALASVMLTSGTSIVSTNQSVKAAYHSINSSYWNKDRIVRVKKATTFHKYDALKDRILKSKHTFRRGKIIEIRAAGEFKGWVLSGNKRGSRYYWISTKGNTKWMIEYSLSLKDGFHGNTYTSKNGSKLRVDKIMNLKVKDPTGFPENVILMTGHFYNNGSKAISVPKFVDNEIDIKTDNADDVFTFDYDELKSTTWESQLEANKQPVSPKQSCDFVISLATSNDDDNVKPSMFTLKGFEGRKFEINASKAN